MGMHGFFAIWEDIGHHSLPVVSPWRVQLGYLVLAILCIVIDALLNI
jgi:hypothetical protein